MCLARVFVWFSLTASAALVAGFGLLGFLTAQRGPGPGAPLEGVAQIIMLTMAAGCGAAFLVLLRFRPRRGLSATRLALSAAVYFVAGFTAFTAARAAGSQVIELRVLDPTSRPVSDAEVTFEHTPRGGGFAALRSESVGSIQTDSTGRAVIATDRRHQSRGRITHPGFAEVTYNVDRDWGGGRQQVVVSWLDPRTTHRKGHSIPTKDMRSFNGYIPAARRATLTVFLPVRGRDEPLPYPKQ